MSDAETLTVEKTGILEELSDITYELEMDDRIAHFADGGKLSEQLQAVWPIVEPHIHDALERFFDMLFTFEEARNAIDTSRLDTIKKRQVEFWQHLFTAPIDRLYGQVISERGAYMHRVGLVPRYYLPAYAAFFDHILACVSESLAEDQEQLSAAVVAVNRLNSLLTEIMISTHHELVRQDSARVLEEHGKNFEDEVVSTLQTVTESVQRMRNQAEEVSQALSTMTESSNSVTNAANDSAENVSTAASAAEQLSNSINQVTSQVKQTAESSNEAAQAAESSVEVINELSEYSDKIGNVIKLIDDIAGQTNLLALNATIEAARAGEAGRGFAVVANEVKSLASQTAKATGDITQQIEAVQENTRKMVEANKQVRTKIENVSTAANEISSLVDEQSEAINNITRSVTDAAQRTGDVSSNISEISGSVGNIGGTMEEVRRMADEVSEHTQTLSEKVDGFLTTIRGDRTEG